MTKTRSRDSWRQLFKWLEILSLQSQYLFSVLLFVLKNKDLYSTNQEIHNINPLNTELNFFCHLLTLLGAHHILHVSRIRVNTRSNINLHLPVCNLTLFQKGAYFSGIKLFNHLPPKIKSLSNEIKLFKTALKRFLNTHSFYFIEEYLEYGYN
jgi:hypothetical protein